MLGKYFFKMIKEFIKNILFNFKKNKVFFAPIFIIGCGRSGTTILGNTLSKHPQIKYLNERRDLWHKAYPEFNIWQEGIENPLLFVCEKSIDLKKNTLLKKLFFREQVLGNAQILLEKLPINNFRLQFLHKSFPEAKYIYLTRNGLEVSNSIEKRIKKKNWFTGIKLELLQKEIKEEFDTTVKSNLHKGMWEWKLSMQESNQFFNQLEPTKFTHLSYQNFIENTENSLKIIFDFLQLSYNDEFIKTSSKNIKRKNKRIIITNDKKLYEIGGEILTKTINNTYSPF